MTITASIPSMCFITPTFRRDFQQFALQRRTMAAFAADIPHVVIVDEEDMGLFRSRFRDDLKGNLILKSSKDVLPTILERGRYFARFKFLRSFFKRVPGGPILSRGWCAQQLMKIYALAAMEYDFAVLLDSDVFLCGFVTPEFFLRDGLPRLFEGPADDAEKMDFDISTHLILGRPLHQVKQLYDYIFSPSVFRKSTAAKLLEVLTERGTRRWLKDFHLQRRPSEYNLLGYVAREIEGYEGYRREPCLPSDLHYSIRYEKDLEHLQETISSLKKGNNDRKFFLLQSTLGLEGAALEKIIDQCLEKLVG